MSDGALIIVQARMGSSRFPGKSLAEIGGRPILWYLFRQLSYCRHPVTPILATTDQAADDPLARYAAGQGWAVFRGSEHDVLGRYHDAAVAFGAGPETVIVRVTGDDIWPDPRIIDAALDLHAAFADQIDCVLTPEDGRLPYGLDHESYTFRTLERAHREAGDAYDREHVTPYIKRNAERFRRIELAPGQPHAAPPLSIDTPEDLERNGKLLAEVERNCRPPYSLSEVLAACAVLWPDHSGSCRPDVRCADGEIRKIT